MREQKEQEKQNELLRVVAEQNHERLIEYDVKEDRAVVYAIENDRFEVLFDIEDYVKKNHYGSVFIDPEDKKVFRRAMHACLQKEGLLRSMSVIAKKKSTGMVPFLSGEYCGRRWKNRPYGGAFLLCAAGESHHGTHAAPGRD